MVRGLALYVAGALEMRFLRTMLYNAISSVLWMGFLMGCGLLTAGTWDELRTNVREVQGVFGLVAVAVVLAALLWFWYRSSSPLGLERLPEPEPGPDH